MSHPKQTSNVSLKDRRRFLRLSVAGTAGVVVSGGVLRWFAGGYAHLLNDHDFPIALSKKEFAVVKSLVQSLLPEGQGFPSGESLQIAQRFDEEVWAAGKLLKSDLHNGLQVLEHAPLLVGYYHRFSSLPLDDRRACFTKFLQGQNKTLRQIAVGLKEMLHLFYYANPGVWPLIGYEGPFVGKPQPPDSKLAYARILEIRRRPS